MKRIWLHGGEIITWRAVRAFGWLQCFYISTLQGANKRPCDLKISLFRSDQQHAPATASRWSSCLCSFTEAALSHYTKFKIFSTPPEVLWWWQVLKSVLPNPVMSYGLMLIVNENALCGDLWPLTTKSKLFSLDWVLLVELDRNTTSEFHGNAPLWWWMMEWWKGQSVCVSLQWCTNMS